MAAVPAAESIVLPEFAARELLAAYGIPFAPAALTRNPEEATRFAERIGYPVVLKVASPDISHKTEVGGVRVGIQSGTELRSAWDEVNSTVRARAPSACISAAA